MVSSTNAYPGQNASDALLDRIHEQITDHSLKKRDETSLSVTWLMSINRTKVVLLAREVHDIESDVRLEAIQAGDRHLKTMDQLDTLYEIPWPRIVSTAAMAESDSFSVHIRTKEIPAWTKRDITYYDTTVPVEKIEQDPNAGDSVTTTKKTIHVKDISVKFSTLTAANRLRDLLRQATAKFGRAPTKSHK